MTREVYDEVHDEEEDGSGGGIDAGLYVFVIWLYGLWQQPR